MKVSIITLTYNSINTISHTIESNLVKLSKYRKIWIDNCSNDGTLQYLKSKKDNQTILVSEKDKGIFDAFNKGVSASGNIVGFLHSDDFYKKNTISNIVKEFQNNDINLSYGDLDYIDKKNKVRRRWTQLSRKIKDYRYFKTKINLGWMPPHPTTYFPRIY